MMKSRIAMGVVLTAGLGLTGVVTASSSGAATPQPAKAATAAQGTVLSASRPASARAFAPAHGKRGDKGAGMIVVCFVGKKTGGAHGLPGLPPLPAPGTGKTVVAPGGAVVKKPGKPGESGRPGKVTITVKDGKAYINGKRVPLSKVTAGCPAKLPPGVPGKPGKPGKPGTSGASGTSAKPGTSVGTGASGLSSSGVPGGDEQGVTVSRLDG